MPGPVSTGTGDHLQVGKPPPFVTSHSGQLSLPPSAGQKMSTGQNAVMYCGWGVKAGTVYSTCGYTRGWQVKLCDPSLTRAIPERFRDVFLMIYKSMFSLLYFTILIQYYITRQSH